MRFVAVFLSEDVGEVAVAGDVLDADKASRLGFAYGIVPHLEVTKAFGGHGLRPIDTGLVVVVEGNGGGHEDGLEVEVG